MKKKGFYSAATLAKKTTIINLFLRFLFEEEYIKEPIHRGLMKVKVKKEDRPNRDLGPKEVIGLLDYFRDINHPVAFSLVHVLTTTGIRNEELCTLNVEDMKYDSITGGYYLEIMGKGKNGQQH